MSRTTDGHRAVRARRNAAKHHADHARQEARLEALETETTRLAGHHPRPVDWSTADLSGLGRRR